MKRDKTILRDIALDHIADCEYYGIKTSFSEIRRLIRDNYDRIVKWKRKHGNTIYFEYE